MKREQAEQIAQRVMNVMLRSMISRGEAAKLCVDAIMEAAAIERADEREACAKVCDQIQRECGECPETASNCAESIRTRGNE